MHKSLNTLGISKILLPKGIQIAFAAISFTIAQDLDKILQLHYKAVGQKNILNVNSMQATGTAVMMMGGANSFEMMSKRPDKLLVIVEFQDLYGLIAKIKNITMIPTDSAELIRKILGSIEFRPNTRLFNEFPG